MSRKISTRLGPRLVVHYNPKAGVRSVATFITVLPGELLVTVDNEGSPPSRAKLARWRDISTSPEPRGGEVERKRKRSAPPSPPKSVEQTNTLGAKKRSRSASVPSNHRLDYVDADAVGRRRSRQRASSPPSFDDAAAPREPPTAASLLADTELALAAQWRRRKVAFDPAVRPPVREVSARSLVFTPGWRTRSSDCAL